MRLIIVIEIFLGYFCEGNSRLGKCREQQQQRLTAKTRKKIVKSQNPFPYYPTLDSVRFTASISLLIYIFFVNFASFLVELTSHKRNFIAADEFAECVTLISDDNYSHDMINKLGTRRKFYAPS